MRISCPSCAAEYEVDKEDLPPEGQEVQCSDCMTIWMQTPDEPTPEPVENTPEPETAAQTADNAMFAAIRNSVTEQTKPLDFPAPDETPQPEEAVQDEPEDANEIEVEVAADAEVEVEPEVEVEEVETEVEVEVEPEVEAVEVEQTVESPDAPVEIAEEPAEIQAVDEDPEQAQVADDSQPEQAVEYAEIETPDIETPTDAQTPLVEEKADDTSLDDAISSIFAAPPEVDVPAPAEEAPTQEHAPETPVEELADVMAALDATTEDAPETVEAPSPAETVEEPEDFMAAFNAATEETAETVETVEVAAPTVVEEAPAAEPLEVPAAKPANRWASMLAAVPTQEPVEPEEAEITIEEPVAELDEVPTVETLAPAEPAPEPEPRVAEEPESVWGNETTPADETPEPETAQTILEHAIEVTDAEESVWGDEPEETVETPEPVAEVATPEEPAREEYKSAISDAFRTRRRVSFEEPEDNVEQPAEPDVIWAPELGSTPAATNPPPAAPEEEVVSAPPTPEEPSVFPPIQETHTARATPSMQDEKSDNSGIPPWLTPEETTESVEPIVHDRVFDEPPVVEPTKEFTESLVVETAQDPVEPPAEIPTEEPEEIVAEAPPEDDEIEEAVELESNVVNINEVDLSDAIRAQLDVESTLESQPKDDTDMVARHNEMIGQGSEMPSLDALKHSVRNRHVNLGNTDEVAPKKSRFMRGFILTLLLFAIVIGVYMGSGKIATMVPAAAPAMEIYVGLIDQLRVILANVGGAVKQLLG